MASRTVQLFKYIKVDGKWKYAKAVIHSNNKLKPHAVHIGKDAEGKPVEHIIKDGYYVLYYSRTWEPVGTDPVEAYRAYLRKAGALQMVANGGTLPVPVQVESRVVAPGIVPVAQPVSGSLTIKAAFDLWIDDHRNADAHQDTIDAKELVSLEFQQSIRQSKEKFLCNVTRAMCQRYFNHWCKGNGNSDRTRFNKFLHLRQMLHFHGIYGLITTKDAPDYDNKEVLAIEEEELEVFWQHCPQHYHLMFMMLLCTGLRLSEIATLRWADLIGGSQPHVLIQSRPEYEFTPKKHHCREVSIAEPEIWAQLMRRKMVSKSKLVFPNRNGTPMWKLWDCTQRIFRRAGLNMAKAHPHCFRATYCTTLLRQRVPMPEVMYLMGHKDMETTERYTAPLKKEKRHENVAEVNFKLPQRPMPTPPVAHHGMAIVA